MKLAERTLRALLAALFFGALAAVVISQLAPDLTLTVVTPAIALVVGAVVAARILAATRMPH